MKPPASHFMFAKVHPTGHVWIESLAWTREWAASWPHAERDPNSFGTEVRVFQVDIAPVDPGIAAEVELTLANTSKRARQAERGLPARAAGTACTTRRGYPTRAVAEAASRVKAKTGFAWRAVACDLCFQWHLERAPVASPP